jgi:Tfp pilus assembly protein PilN
MIVINFASRNYRLIERSRIGLVAGSVVLCVVMAALIWHAVSLRRDITAMDRRLMEAVAVDEQVKPVLMEREQLAKDLSSMSGLMESRKISWTRFLTSLETVVPHGVALTHVKFNVKDRTLTIEGIAQSPEALRSLVVGLERSTSFQDPFLKNQSLEKGSISFNVVAVYQEHKGAGTSQGGK